MGLSLDNKEIYIAKSFLYFNLKYKVHKCNLHNSEDQNDFFYKFTKLLLVYKITVSKVK